MNLHNCFFKDFDCKLTWVILGKCFVKIELLTEWAQGYTISWTDIWSNQSFIRSMYFYQIFYMSSHGQTHFYVKRMLIFSYKWIKMACVIHYVSALLNGIFFSISFSKIKSQTYHYFIWNFSFLYSILRRLFLNSF